MNNTDVPDVPKETHMKLVLEDSQTLTSVTAPLTFTTRDGTTPVSLPSRPGEGEGRY